MKAEEEVPTEQRQRPGRGSSAAIWANLVAGMPATAPSALRIYSSVLSCYTAAAAVVAAVDAQAAAGPSSAGWDNPTASARSNATVRYSALGLFAQPAAGSGSSDERASSGLAPAIGKVAKSGKNPLFSQDKPWEPRLDNGYPNVVYDADLAAKGDGPWRLWYGGIGPGGQYVYYANSTDGLEWAKPDMVCGPELFPGGFSPTSTL